MSQTPAAGPGPSPAGLDAASVQAISAEVPGVSVGRSFLITMMASGGTIVMTLISGVLTARLLGVDGRGQVAAITAWMLTLSWATSFGFSDAMIYQQSKRTASEATILSTTLLSVPLLGVIGVVLGQVLVPVGFSAQSDETQALARIFFYGIPFLLGVNSVTALLAGQQRFGALSWVRLAQPASFAAVLVVLALADLFTVFAVLTAFLSSFALVLVLTAVNLIRRDGWHRPSLVLARRGLGFGLRLQGVALGQLVTARLDLMLLPAFVMAADVGYYAIAVSIVSMVAVLFGSLSMVVFPMASRSEGLERSRVIERGLRLALVGGAITVLFLGLLAPWLVSLVYGDAFLPAVPALRLLLPGIVLWSACSILDGGLQAVNRPGRASLVQLLGLIVTAAGLLLTLPRAGILGAAATSSVAYALTFTVSLLVLRRAGGVSVRAALAISALRQDLLWLAQRLRQLVRPRAPHAT